MKISKYVTFVLLLLIPCATGLSQTTTATEQLKPVSETEKGGEDSVRPGVNKSFIDPNLDVDAYVKRFEIESRDWLIGHVRAGKEVFRAEIQDTGFTLVEEKKIDGFEENYFLKFRKN